MKKIFVVLGITLFFTCTAIDISFTNWTLIEKAFRMEAITAYEKNHASLIIHETIEMDGNPYYVGMCVCNDGYAYDPTAKTCVK